MARPKRIIICPDCGEEKLYWAKGLCGACYTHHWRQANREKYNAQMRCWRSQNPERAARANADSYRKHREKRLTHDRNYRDKHQGEISARRRRWREGHREQELARMRRWYEAHREEVLIRRRQDCQRHPEKAANMHALRKARKRGVAHTATPENIEFERKMGIATYGPGEVLQLHHCIPFSRDGNHSWGNIMFIPAWLNLSIKDKLPREVYRQLSFVVGSH